MSIKLMSAVWDQSGLSGSELLVMLALADHANDDGECWPSMGRVAGRARMTERGARKIIVRLQEQGLLTRQIGRGRGHANLYHITIKAEPETRNEVPPSEDKTGTRVLKTGTTEQKTGTPVPPNHQEPSKNRHSEDAREARSVLSEAVGNDLAGEFGRYRVRMRKPLTPTAAKRLVSTLHAIHDQHGIPPPEALAEAMERGWQGVKVDWFKPKEQRNGQSSREQEHERRLQARLERARAFDLEQARQRGG